MTEDMYSLMQTLIRWELKAHLGAVKHATFTKGLEYAAEERAYRRVIEKIQNGKANQRPHVSRWSPVIWK
jgi:hypothetical protein